MLQILCKVIGFVEVDIDSAENRTRNNIRKGLVLGSAMLLLTGCLFVGMWSSYHIWTRVLPYDTNVLVGFLGMSAFFLTGMILLIVDFVFCVLLGYHLYLLLVKRAFDQAFCQMFDVKPQVVRQYRWATEHLNLWFGNFRLSPYTPARIWEAENEAKRKIVAAVRQKLLRLALKVDGLPEGTSDFDVQVAKEAFRTALTVARLFSHNHCSRFFPTKISDYVTRKDDQVWLNAQNEGTR